MSDSEADPGPEPETMVERLEALRVQLHILVNAVNAMSLKMEVILAQIRRRGE